MVKYLLQTKPLLKRIAVIFAIYALVILIMSLLQLDFFIPRRLYNPQLTPPWPDFDAPLWNFLYHYGPVLPLSIGIISLIGIFIGSLKEYRKSFIFIVLVILIGPGLIVQSLKNTWGRPRPGEIIEFGGPYQYHAVYSPNFKLTGNPDDGKSFPSGHASIGFSLMFFYFILRKKNRKAAISIFAFSVLFGSIMGTTRMVQGGHFISDVVTSFFIVLIVCNILSFIFLENCEKKIC